MVAEIENHQHENDEGGKAMSLFAHLNELRVRIFHSVIVVLIFFICSLYFAGDIFTELKKPLLAALPVGKDLTFISPTEGFLAPVKTAVVVSLILACPFWIFQLWRFVEPALYPHEKKYVTPFMLASVVLFFLGVAFSFYVILPFAIEFLINFGSQFALPEITLGNYVSMLMMFVFGFGLAFETPVIIVLLGMLDIVTADALAEYRRFVLVGIVTLAALLTPPDPISQLALAVPLYLMYEISIHIIRIIKRQPDVAS